MSTEILTVEEDHQGLRLDVFLTQSLSAPSRTFIKRLIDTGSVLVNDRSVKAHYKVARGDTVTVDLPQVEEEPDLAPEDIPLDIFYEDQWLLIINKPAGMLVHPARGQNTGTLVNALLHYCKAGKSLSAGSAKFRPGIVHRLDRETSGLICVAKDEQTHVRMARAFEKHRVMKRYVALVKGDFNFEEGKIDAPLGRHPRHFDKKAIVFDESGKEAVTYYRVLKRFDKKATLVALFPQSGRTHQLRVHMAHIGHPVLGDGKYGSQGSFPRLALHAQSIGFQHPQTRKYVEFSTPTPEEFLIPKI